MSFYNLPPPNGNGISQSTNNSQNLHRSKRPRDQPSCTLCRQGKLKCNRAHPACDQCQKRSRESSCFYLTPPTKPITKPIRDVKGRIKHLEGLVVSFMNAAKENMSSESANIHLARQENGKEPGADAPGLHLAIEEQRTGLEGQMSGEGGGTRFVGGAHWEAILNEITEVNRCLGDDENGDDQIGEQLSRDVELESLDPALAPVPEVLLGAPAPISKSELLASMPAREMVDQLVSRWFNSKDPIVFILHAPTFQDEYRQFWKDPSNAPVMWLGLLYSIMCLGAFFVYRAGGDASPSSESSIPAIHRYRTLAASAIVLADYTKPQPYTLESLIVYTGNELLRNDAAQVKVWVLTGMIMRLALRMGYHRDSSHYVRITPFQGEMRRRVWHLLDQLDVLVSFHLGLPSMIRKIQSDTGPPHNLMDRDFSVDSIDLPPSRPAEEITLVSYPIAKSRLCAVFATAAEISHAVIPPAYSEVLSLDDRLNEAYRMIPSGLRMRTMDQSITDPPDLIMSRTNLELLYQKSRCVLHRRYLSEAQNDTRFTYSRQTCLDAAMTTLRHQSMVYHASLPGGQLHSVRWYMSSISAHDFLLAAMIICLKVNLNNKPSSRLSTDETLVEQEDMIEALEASYRIWQKSGSHPAETYQALAIMLRKIKEGRLSSNGSKTPGIGTTELSNDSSSLNQSTSPGVGLGLQNAQPTDAKQLSIAFSPQFLGTMDSTNPTPIGDMLDMPLNLDWETWDNHINGQKDLNLDQWLTNMADELPSPSS